jgi:hypothetical protein
MIHMFWIEYRDLVARESVLMESDDIQEATVILAYVALSPAFKLIDFSGDLDGALDHPLAGVKLFDDGMTQLAKAA